MVLLSRIILISAIGVSVVCGQVSRGSLGSKFAVLQPITISGRVIAESGGLIPNNVVINLRCGTAERTVAYANSSGQFGFDLGGSEPPGVADRFGLVASGSGDAKAKKSGIGLNDCDLRASAPGFVSTAVTLDGFAGDGDVGTFSLHRLGAAEGNLVSYLTLKAPRDAKKAFERGTGLVRAGKLAEAEAAFQKAIAVYPQYADAWLSLGLVQSQVSSREVARESFGKATELDPTLAAAWQALGYLACDQARWEEAARYLDKAVRLEPSSTGPWYFDALANYNLRRWEQAERSVRKELALEGERTVPGSEFLLGMILVARRDPDGGAQVLRRFLTQWPQERDAGMAKEQLSRLESSHAP